MSMSPEEIVRQKNKLIVRAFEAIQEDIVNGVVALSFKNESMQSAYNQVLLRSAVSNAMVKQKLLEFLKKSEFYKQSKDKKVIKSAIQKQLKNLVSEILQSAVANSDTGVFKKAVRNLIGDIDAEDHESAIIHTGPGDANYFPALPFTQTTEFATQLRAAAKNIRPARMYDGFRNLDYSRNEVLVITERLLCDPVYKALVSNNPNIKAKAIDSYIQNHFQILPREMGDKLLKEYNDLSGLDKRIAFAKSYLANLEHLIVATNPILAASVAKERNVDTILRILEGRPFNYAAP